MIFGAWDQIGFEVWMLEQSRFAGGHGAPKMKRIEKEREGAQRAADVALGSLAMQAEPQCWTRA
jgi:hypothetical protein